LLTTATITFIEAMRTQNPMIRHILNLETCISIVAGYFYSIFVSKSSQDFQWSEITPLRYLDWCITTPMMLISLCLALGMNSKVPLRFTTLVAILLLNYVMIGSGYMGEKENRLHYDIIGYGAFFAMFYIIYRAFVGTIMDNYVLFGAYLVVWGMYGVVYMMEDTVKNIALNYLDLTAKCLIGLGLWAYYTKIVRV